MVGNIRFSPDGTKLCYIAGLREKEYYYTHIPDRTIEIYDIESKAHTQPLTDFDSSVMPLRWTDKGILLIWQDKTNYVIGLLSDNGKIDMLSEKTGCCIFYASITPDGKHISYINAKDSEIFEVYLDGRKITDENSHLSGKLKSNKEVISWQSSDNLKIEGVLTTPVDFDPNKKYPLLVINHGGPSWASFATHSSCFTDKYPVEQFIEKGFIILEPNFRGSSGYGNKFMISNYKKMGMCDYDDVISGVDLLVNKGFIDKARVGIMGDSYGGLVTTFCALYGERFKAASDGGGIINWRTQYAYSDLPQFPCSYLGGTPWNNEEAYAKTSPITYIKSAHTPILIQHGEDDPRVPIANSYELYRGLKDMKVDTELMIFKGMGHSANNPRESACLMTQNLIWFSHYILGESLEGLRSI